MLLNYLKLNKNINLELKSLDNSELGTNSWLAGFIDADGCFDIRYTDGLKKLRIASRFRIEQRLNLLPKFTDNSDYKDIMSKIAEEFNTKVNISNKKTGKSYFVINASSKSSIIKILKYFNKYTLLTKKFFDYEDFKKVSEMILNKEHLKVENRLKIREIKLGMNTLRKFYQWEFLKEIKYV